MDDRLPPTPAHQISADEMDGLAQQAARAVCTGTVTRDAGHAYLAGLLYQVVIPEQVAGDFLKDRSHARGQQTPGDLASALRALMVRKVMLDSAGQSVLNLTAVAAGTSFAGFCRKFMQTAALSENRNLDRAYRVTPVLSFAGRPRDEQRMAGRLPGVAHQPEPGDDALDEAASTFETRARACPPLELLHLQADTLAKALDLPRPERPAAALDRQTVLTELDADPNAAWRAVRGLTDGSDVEGPLAEMFAGCRMRELDVLADASPQVVEVLARSAASHIPPLRQRIATELSHRMLDQLPRNSKSRRLASQTLRRWLAKSSTIIGDEFSRGWTPKPDEQIADEAAEFCRAATMLILDGCFGEFAEPGQIDRWLMAQADQVAVEQAAERQAREVQRAGGQTPD